MEHGFSGAECKAFTDLLKKAATAATGKNGKIAVRVSGRTFGDGTCGVVLICWNGGGSECHVITKTPPELQNEVKERYRELLKRIDKRTA